MYKKRVTATPTVIEISTEMERPGLHLAVILLASSFLLASLTAVRLPRDQAFAGVGGVHETIRVEGTTDELFLRGRMDLASNDYPGAGPNGKHTPKPPA